MHAYYLPILIDWTWTTRLSSISCLLSLIFQLVINL